MAVPAGDIDRAPYVGPLAFKTEDEWRFFGRDHEVDVLRDLLLAERIVLFYSPSGAGKTSLVQAALLPRLKEDGFRILPVMRVNLEPSSTTDGNVPNRYINSILFYLEEGLPAEERTPADELATHSLSSYLDQHRPPAGEDGPAPELLVFDQFEEILTVDPTDRVAKEEFFRQVGAALVDRRRWALFCMREDYLGGLDPYRRYFPTRLATTGRLDLLGAEAGMDAIQEPARKVGVRFADEAARKLVEDLSRVRTEQNGHIVEKPGPYVEPVNLQVVCLNLWERLPPGTVEIGEEHLAVGGSVDSALADYYASRVDGVCERTGISQRIIREWIEEKLITDRGVRTQVLLEPECSQGLDNRAVLALVDAYLVRTEKRRGETWVELAHDRLVEPVRANNAAWFETNLSVLQREAELWNDHGRSHELLLGGQVLKDAEVWARDHSLDLTPIDYEFLSASREAHKRFIRNRVLWTLVVVGLVLLTGAALGSWRLAEKSKAEAIESKTVAIRSEAAAKESEATAIAAREEAVRQANIARARQLAANALNHTDDRVDLALLLSLQANSLLDASEEPLPDIRGSLLSSVASRRDIVGFLRGHTALVNSVALSPDGKTLASGSMDGTIILWGVLTQLPLGPPLDAHPGGVFDVAFSPDGQRLASAGFDSKITLWDIGDVTAPAEIDSHDSGADSVWSVEFSSDGKTLASGDVTGSVILWDATTGDQLGEPLLGHTNPVYMVTFNDDGTLLASAGGDSKIILWDVAKRIPRGDPLIGHEGEVDSLDFSPDGTLLVSGGSDDNVILWDVATGTQKGNPLSGHENTVFGVAFSPDGSMLASASADKRIILWDLVTGESKEIQVTQWGPPLEGYRAPMWSLAFGSYISSGYEYWTLVSGAADGTIVLWNPSRTASLTQNLDGQSDAVDTLAFSSDGKTLASDGDDGSVILRNTTDWSEKLRLDNRNPVDMLDFSPDDTTLATASCGSFGEDDTCAKAEIRLWDVNTGRQLKALTGYDGWVSALAFSPDGKTLATGGMDGQVLLWDVATGQYQATAVSLDEAVWSLAFSPDGKILASGNSLGWVVLWDASTGVPLDEPLLEHDDLVSSLTFSPDGTLLASGNSRGEVILWDVPSRERQRVLLEHTATLVKGLAFIGQDGRTLASASTDGQIVLWDVATHQPIAPPLTSGALNEIWSIAASPDGHTLVTGGEGGRIGGFVQVWNLDFESLPSLACQLLERNLTPEEGADYLGDSTPPVTCPTGLLSEATRLAHVGDREQASRVFDEAVRWAFKTDDAVTSNQICWHGTILGFPDRVLLACNRAVKLAPEDGNARDSRGVARALTGNFAGAITDFQSFVAWAEDEGLADEFIDLRKTWIAALQAGRSPFDEETLKKLRLEVPEFALPEEESVDGLATPGAGGTGSAVSAPAPTPMPLPSPPAIATLVKLESSA